MEIGIGLAFCSFWKKGENTRQKTVSFAFLLLPFFFFSYENIKIRREKSRRITNKKGTDIVDLKSNLIIYLYFSIFNKFQALINSKVSFVTKEQLLQCKHTCFCVSLAIV